MNIFFQAYRYTDYESDIQRIMHAYASVIDHQVIGYSVQNRPLHSFTIGKGPRRIQISAAHHAREWISTWLVMQQIYAYAKLYMENRLLGDQSIRALLDQVAIQFIPIVNPDGFILATEGWEQADLSYEAYAQMAKVNGIGDEYWLWKANIRGVDLNRQYPMNWEYIKNSPSRPAAMNYKGDTPYSEPEVVALVQDITQAPPLMLLAYHSAGEEIFWFHGQEGCIKDRDFEIAKRLAILTDYTLIPEEEFVAGGYADWFVYTYLRPAFTIEIGVEPHPVDMTQANRIWEQNQYLPFIALQESLKLI